MKPGVDDLHAGVAQRRGHHLGAAVVPVEARLSHQHPDPAWHRVSLAVSVDPEERTAHHIPDPKRTIAVRRAAAPHAARPAPGTPIGCARFAAERLPVVGLIEFRHGLLVWALRLVEFGVGYGRRLSVLVHGSTNDVGLEQRQGRARRILGLE